MTRFGVCGTAFWAESVHVPGLAANPGIELAGVWGRDPGRTSALARSSGIRAFASFEEMLASVDAVSFAVPPAAQADLALQAIRAGRHVLLEKPLAPSLAQAAMLVREASLNGVAALCFLTRMFVPEVGRFVAQARSISPSSGEAGFRSDALVGGPYAASQWRQARHGALWDAAPHGMSVLVAVLGSIAEVSAAVAPDGAHGLSFRHAGGAASRLDLNLRDPSVRLAERYVFSNGRAVELPGLAYDRRDTFRHASAILLGAIRGEAGPGDTRLAMALHLVAVAEAAQESLESAGRSVGVAETPT